MIVSAVAAVVSAWILRRQEKKAEGTDLERVSIKINRLRGMKKC